MKRLSFITFFLMLCLAGTAFAQFPSNVNDRWRQAWQNCAGQPCLNIKTVQASGPWTAGGALNDLMFQAFSNCAGVPCLTASISGGGGSGTVTNTAGALTANQLVIGNGGNDIKTLGTLGTTTTLLHGNAAGAPTFNPVSLTADVTGTLPVGNGGTGQTTASPFVVSATRPNQALTNSAAADADFNSVFTIPANTIGAQKWLVVTLHFSYATGVTPASELFYLKLGATKVFIGHAAGAPAASVTRTFALQYFLIGTAAAGASVPIDVSAAYWTNMGGSQVNTLNGTAVATNGTLTIVPGVTWGSSSNADTLTLIDAMVQSLN